MLCALFSSSFEIFSSGQFGLSIFGISRISSNFALSLDKTRGGRYVLISCDSTMSTEVLTISANDPSQKPNTINPTPNNINT